MLNKHAPCRYANERSVRHAITMTYTVCNDVFFIFKIRHSDISPESFNTYIVIVFQIIK